jgi:hypothetical protein
MLSMMVRSVTYGGMVLLLPAPGPSKTFDISIDYAAKSGPQTGSRMGIGYIESEASILMLSAV